MGSKAIQSRTLFEREKALALVTTLKDPGNGYIDVRVLPDGSVAALVELLTTRAILLGCNEQGWSSRFCFADRVLATKQFYLLKSEDDEPKGFIARRPELRDEHGNYIGAEK